MRLMQRLLSCSQQAVMDGRGFGSQNGGTSQSELAVLRRYAIPSQAPNLLLPYRLNRWL